MEDRHTRCFERWVRISVVTRYGEASMRVIVVGIVTDSGRDYFSLSG